MKRNPEFCRMRHKEEKSRADRRTTDVKRWRVAFNGTGGVVIDDNALVAVSCEQAVCATDFTWCSLAISELLSVNGLITVFYNCQTIASCNLDYTC